VPEALDRLADVDRLVQGHADLHARRHADELRQELPHLVHHRDRVGAGLLVDVQHDAALGVDAHDRGLRLVGVVHAPDVLDVDGRQVRADVPDDDVLHRLDELELVVRVEVIVPPARLHVAGGQEEVRVVHHPHDVEDREPLGVELVAVQVHRDLADPPAVHRG